MSIMYVFSFIKSGSYYTHKFYIPHFSFTNRKHFYKNLSILKTFKWLYIHTFSLSDTRFPSRGSSGHQSPIFHRCILYIVLCLLPLFFFCLNSRIHTQLSAFSFLSISHRDLRDNFISVNSVNSMDVLYLFLAMPEW